MLVLLLVATSYSTCMASAAGSTRTECSPPLLLQVCSTLCEGAGHELVQLSELLDRNDSHPHDDSQSHVDSDSQSHSQGGDSQPQVDSRPQVDNQPRDGYSQPHDDNDRHRSVHPYCEQAGLDLAELLQGRGNLTLPVPDPVLITNGVIWEILQSMDTSKGQQSNTTPAVLLVGQLLQFPSLDLRATESLRVKIARVKATALRKRGKYRAQFLAQKFSVISGEQIIRLATKTDKHVNIERIVAQAK